MLKLLHRSKVLLSLEQEVERQTTEEQIAENEGHEQLKESHRIEPAAKAQGQGGKGAANNTVDFEELRKYSVLVMTLITTVTFAAAFQMPGGYDGNGKAILVKSRDFRYFLMYDTLSFCSSAASLLIYFAMPMIQKTFDPIAAQTLAPLLSMTSLTFMFLAFSLGVAAVLDEESSLYSHTKLFMNVGLFFPILMVGTLVYKSIIRMTVLMTKTRPFRS